jgi:hypothetical protein
MTTEIPTEDQRRALAEILMQAFLELRAAPDSPERVFKLADVMHNVPLEMVIAYP